MRFGGRIQGAIEVLEDVINQHTPVNDALRDWGKAHRFAGSKDRAAIGNLVLDSLRRKSSMSFLMDDERARAIAIGTLGFVWGHSAEDLDTAFADDPHSPAPLTDHERECLGGSRSLDSADAWVQADIPEWIWPAFENNYGDYAIVEGQALRERPPLDIRVNTLKTTKEDATAALESFAAHITLRSPIGLRVVPGIGLERLPNIQNEPIYLTGGVEIQDEGSQIASLLVDAKPGELVLDYCAGAGGKSLALAADMDGEGKVYSYDIDKRRLSPLFQRALRAGAENINIIQPPMKNLNELKGKMDRVLIDAPCSGSGTWRRKPDAKWRLSVDSLEIRLKEQRQVLDQAKDFVKSGGLLFYVTCSMFAEENEGQVYAFLEQNKDFELLSAGETFEEKFGVEGRKPWSEDGCTLTMTPLSTNTDGFFFSVMERK